MGLGRGWLSTTQASLTSFPGFCTVMDEKEASSLFPLEASLLAWCRVPRLLLFNKEPCMCPGVDRCMSKDS